MDLGLLWDVVLLVLCLFLSAFFSGLEMALTSLSAASTKRLIENRPLYAFALSLWLKKPNYVLSAILVGNNIVNTLAAAVFALSAQSIFKSYAITLTTFIITLLLLIFSEITPKTFARHNAEKMAPVAITLFLPIYFLLWPITFLMNFLFVGRSLRPTATAEEIAYMIRMGNEEGVLKRQDGHLLQSVMEFRKTTAKESMVPRTEISSFEANTPYEEVLSRIKEEGHTRWPVYENNIDNIIGIFHVKDLLSQINTHSPEHFCLRHFLRPAKFIPDMMKIGSLLKEFQAGKAHLAIVVDEYGGTAGIISLEDVLEEIVGDIRDEYDNEENERLIQKLDNNNYLVNGKAKISDLGKLLDVDFPESDAFDSLGGFLTSIYGRMPRVATKITYSDCTFIIKAADEKKITSVHIYQSRLPKLVTALEERVAA